MGFLGNVFGNPQKIEHQGDQRLESGQPYEALQRFQQALRKVGPNDPDAAERLGGKIQRAQASFRTMKLEEAARYLEDDLLEEAADVLGVLRDHADELPPAEAGQVAALEQQLERRRDELDGTSTIATPDAADADPGRMGVRSYEEPLDPVAAEIDTAFEQMLGALPEDDQPHAQSLGTAFRGGFVALQTGRPQEAIEAFRAATEEHPQDGLVLESLAVAYDQVGRDQEAQDLYHQALAADPMRRNARIALAAIRSGVQATEGLQAFARLRQAIEAFAQRGGQGDYEGAIDLLGQGIERDPAFGVNYLIAAVEISLIHRRAQEALGFAERAHESAQSAGGAGGAAPSLWHLLGMAAEVAGDLDRAEDAFDKATRLGGQAMFFRAEYAEFALRHRRSLEEAEKIIFETCIGCQAGRVSPEELDYYGILLSRIQYARGEYKPALDGVERLLRKGPPPVLLPALEQLRQEIRQAMKTTAQESEQADEETAMEEPEVEDETTNARKTGTETENENENEDK